MTILHQSSLHEIPPVNGANLPIWSKANGPFYAWAFFRIPGTQQYSLAVVGKNNVLFRIASSASPESILRFARRLGGLA